MCRADVLWCTLSVCWAPSQIGMDSVTLACVAAWPACGPIIHHAPRLP